MRNEALKAATVAIQVKNGQNISNNAPSTNNDYRRMNDDKDEHKLKRGQRERLNRSPLSTIESSVSNPLAAENRSANKNQKN